MLDIFGKKNLQLAFNVILYLEGKGVTDHNRQKEELHKTIFSGHERTRAYPVEKPEQCVQLKLDGSVCGGEIVILEEEGMVIKECSACRHSEVV